MNPTRSVLLTIAIASLVASAACGAGSDTPPPSPPTSGAPDLAGHWRSSCVPTNGTQSVTLDFRNTASTWALDYVTYADMTCATPFVTAHIEGPYTVTGTSATVAGAWEARLAFDRKQVTPASAAAAGFLASAAGCGRAGFSAATPTDVLELGCPGLGQLPRSTCAADYDLVSIGADGLRFGDRPKDNDLCTAGKRPAKLSALASARVL